MTLEVTRNKIAGKIKCSLPIEDPSTPLLLLYAKANLLFTLLLFKEKRDRLYKDKLCSSAKRNFQLPVTTPRLSKVHPPTTHSNGTTFTQIGTPSSLP